MFHLREKLHLVKAGLKLYAANYDNRLLLEWYLKHRSRLLKFRDIHKGDSCFIIGNGPSLNKMDLSLLKGRYTFGLNKIFLLRDRFHLDVSYHVAVNPLVIEQSMREFEGLDCPSFLSFGAARKHTKGCDHIHMLATDSYFATPYTFHTEPLHPISEGYTVTYVAMQLAFYMGFEKVFLIGVDHSFKSSGNPNQEQHLLGEDPNHFDPRYFSNMNWHLPDLEASEVSYHLARFFYNRHGRQIFDATVDGKLEIFTKISFHDALKISMTR